MASMEALLRAMPPEVQNHMANLPMDQKVAYARQYMQTVTAKSRQNAVSILSGAWTAQRLITR
jgi:hypothetical protein